jgi:CobQ-like glutamine amidotransferase family enzyme
VAERTLRVCALYPDLMNIYADRGNLLLLERRCEWRGIGFELRGAGLGDELDPDAHDLFYLGGGQDRDQALCAQDMATVKRDALHAAAARGAVVFAVCGGLQLLGHGYELGGERLPGVGLVDLETVREDGPRLIGNVAIEVDLGPGSDPPPKFGSGSDPPPKLGPGSDPPPKSGPGSDPPPKLGPGSDPHPKLGPGSDPPPKLGPGSDPHPKLRVLAGFENHGGRTKLGPDATPLGRVLKGHGNDGASGYEGVRGGAHGTVLGTYLHGPLLPKNAWFADWLTATALGIDRLEPLEDSLEDAAHAAARRAAGI